MVSKKQRLTFEHPQDAYRPIYYFDLPAPNAANIDAHIIAGVDACLTAGCGTLIPRLPENTVLQSTDDVNAVRHMYQTLLEHAAKKELKVGFSLDFAFERFIIGRLDDVGEEGLHAKLLECKEYICRAEEQLCRHLQEGELLSLVAYSESYGEVIDLRPFVKEGKLCWQVPHGNWVVREYRALEEPDCRRANYLSYDASYRYIELSFGLFSEVLTPYIGNTLTTLAYSPPSRKTMSA